MRILFVEATDDTSTVKVNETVYEPIGILYLAAYLRKYLPKVEIHVVDRDVEAEIDRFNPDIVAIGFVTINYNIARRHAQAARIRGVKVVAGGAHISAAPRTLPHEMDVGVVGEGERTLLDLVRIFPAKRWEDLHELSAIPGIVFRDPTGNIVITSPRQPEENLDRLPFPARDLFEGRLRGVTSSRGCPYKCSFCFNAHLKKLRYASPESVVDEIKVLARDYGAKHINMFDDLFIMPEKRFNRIVDMLVAEGIPNQVWFGANIRPNNVTPSIARNLSRMNMGSAFLGVESGVQRVLSYLKPQSATVEQNERAIKILNDHGIFMGAGIIIGSPDETKEEILTTLEWLQRSQLDIFEIMLLTPLPGTQVWEEALSRGLVSYEMDWERLDLRVNEMEGREPVVMSKLLSWEKLEELFALFLAERDRMVARHEKKRFYKSLKSLALNPVRIPAKLFSLSSYAATARLFLKPTRP